METGKRQISRKVVDVLQTTKLATTVEILLAPNRKAHNVHLDQRNRLLERPKNHCAMIDAKYCSEARL